MTETVPGLDWPASFEAVRQISRPSSVMVTHEAMLVELVEEPWLAACQSLYAKNIRTLACSANIVDKCRGHAWLQLDLESMSKENQAVALECNAGSIFTAPSALGRSPRESVMIKLWFSGDTPATFSERALRLADTFHWQPMTWAPYLTLEAVTEILAGKFSETALSLEAVLATAQAYGYFFDSARRVFYCSEEHYRKVTNPSTPATVIS